MDNKTPEIAFDGNAKISRDEFERKNIALKIMSLLDANVDIFPMIIDGSWGSGKTEFCQKLITQINRAEENQYKTIYIDSFFADHADEPLFTILSSIISAFPENESKVNIRKIAIPVLRFGLRTVGKAIVARVLASNADDISEGFSEALQSESKEAIDASIYSLLQDHEKVDNNIQALKNSLEELSNNTKIVIFIDELDRCRPDFAVQMLETIKHIFDIPNVNFILVTNKSQLEAAINHRYGQAIDAKRYLDKFIKFSFSLPNFIVNHNAMYYQHLNIVSVEYFFNEIKTNENLKESNLNKGYFDFISELIIINELSLREVNTFIRHLEIYNILSNKDLNKLREQNLYLIIFGVFLFGFHANLLKHIQNYLVDLKDINNILGLNKLPTAEDK